MAPSGPVLLPEELVTTDVSKRAYVTLLAGSGDYWKGVVGLAKGLRKVKSAYPLVVAVLPDVPQDHREILRSQGCIVREIQPIDPPDNTTTFAMPNYVINYSKLRIWEFVEYEKMVYLEGVMQVFANIDNLFDLENDYLHAVRDWFCPDRDKVHWPKHMGSPPQSYFNAGMFVYEPNIMLYYDILDALKDSSPTSFAEQDFLNWYFRKFYKPIHPTYNLILAMLWCHPENIDINKVKVVHYCAAGSKPWEYTGEEENMDREDVKLLVKKWRDIFEDESLDYVNNNNSGNEKKHW